MKDSRFSFFEEKLKPRMDSNKYSLESKPLDLEVFEIEAKSSKYEGFEVFVFFSKKRKPRMDSNKFSLT